MKLDRLLNWATITLAVVLACVVSARCQGVVEVDGSLVGSWSKNLGYHNPNWGARGHAQLEVNSKFALDSDLQVLSAKKLGVGDGVAVKARFLAEYLKGLWWTGGVEVNHQQTSKWMKTGVGAVAGVEIPGFLRVLYHFPDNTTNKSQGVSLDTTFVVWLGERLFIPIRPEVNLTRYKRGDGMGQWGSRVAISVGLGFVRMLWK